MVLTMSATVVHHLTHLLIVEIGMAVQGTESSTVDGKASAQWCRDMEPSVAMYQGRVDFIQLGKTYKPAQPVAVIHYTARPIRTYARHTLQQCGIGCIEIEYRIGTELHTLGVWMRGMAAP